MLEQAEFLKSVRQTVTTAQAKATERFGTIEGDARKVINGLVEKGKESQKDITALLDRKMPEYKAKVEELQKRARTFVDETSRGQAAVVAGELRRIAERLEKLSVKAAETAQAPSAEEVH